MHKKSINQEALKPYLLKGAVLSKKYELPMLKSAVSRPLKAIPFDKAKTTNDYEQYVHFYIHDKHFECIWNDPKKYLALLKKFEGVITTDFSLYRDMPLSTLIWNNYRNRVIAHWLQNNGVNIIFNIRWGDERTYDFVFDGIAKGGTVAISTNGCIRDKLDRHYFKKGLAKMVGVVEPKTIVNYSYAPDDIFKKYKDKGIEVVQIPNHRLTIGKKALPLSEEV